jgi:nucleotide-binding universal stress UspA family protein
MRERRFPLRSDATASNLSPMKAKEVVLVATDMGESADEAVREAHEWASRAGAELVACFVIPRTIRDESAFPPAYSDDSVALLELERRAAQVVRDRVSALTRRAEREFKVLVDGGRTDLAIVRVADEVKASLVVVGNRRSSELDRLLLGSISERVVRYASCSVLVARSHRRTDQILAAIDMSDAALRVVADAARIAARKKASLSVLYCRDPPEAESSSSKRKGRRIGTRMAERIRELLAREKLRGQLEVLDGDPREAIVRRAGQIGAELIVVGTRGRSGLARIMAGSVAETVARTANCPVLSLRLGDGLGS